MKDVLAKAEKAQMRAARTPESIEQSHLMIRFKARIGQLEFWGFRVDRRPAIMARRAILDLEAPRPVECQDLDAIAHPPSEQLVAVSADVGVTRIFVELWVKNQVRVKIELAVNSSGEIER